MLLCKGKGISFNVKIFVIATLLFKYSLEMERVCAGS